MMIMSKPEEDESDMLDYTLIRSAVQEIDELYTLDVVHRYAILRLLLADPSKGILTQKKYKERIGDEILDNLVEASTAADNRTLAILRKMLASYVNTAPMHMTYFTLMPVLLENLFRPPAVLVDAESVMFDAELEGFCADRRPDWNSEQQEAFKTDFRKRFISSREGYEFRDSVWKEHMQKLKSDYQLSEFDVKSLANITGVFKFRTFSPDVVSEQHIRKMSVIEFLKECAKNLGSPGVRFLQLLGQFADIPQEYASEFHTVYDNLRGQSKITAYNTIVREYPRFRTEFSRLEKAIGGGSLNTVYLAETVKGEKMVVKVLNPNVQELNKTAFSVLEQILQTLAGEDSAYALGAEILQDIRQWIENDISYLVDGSEELFRCANNGFSGTGGYRIKVPRLYFHSKRVKIEEYIEGTNLTQLLREKPAGLKEIVSTICRNYVHQLGLGIVHSDVHPGNFRITSSREIAILDRNYYLEFAPEETSSIAGLVGCAMAKDCKGFAGQLGRLLKYDSAEKAVQERIEYLFSRQASLADKMVDLVRRMRREYNVAVPTKLTLLVRNIHALNTFSQAAGFSGVEEALEYSLYHPKPRTPNPKL